MRAYRMNQTSDCTVNQDNIRQGLITQEPNYLITVPQLFPLPQRILF